MEDDGYVTRQAGGVMEMPRKSPALAELSLKTSTASCV